MKRMVKVASDLWSPTFDEKGSYVYLYYSTFSVAVFLVILNFPPY